MLKLAMQPPYDFVSTCTNGRAVGLLTGEHPSWKLVAGQLAYVSRALIAPGRAAAEAARAETTVMTEASILATG